MLMFPCDRQKKKKTIRETAAHRARSEQQTVISGWRDRAPENARRLTAWLVAWRFSPLLVDPSVVVSVITCCVRDVRDHLLCP